MKIKIADVALAVIIACAIGVIGWKFLSVKDKRPSHTKQEGAPAVNFQSANEQSIEALNTAEKPTRRSAFGHRAHMVLESQVAVSSSQIAAFAKSAGAAVLPKSSACKRSGSLVETGFPILSKGLRQKIEINGGGLLLSYLGWRCYQTGSAVEVLYFGDEDSEPYVERLGSFEIKDLLELDYAKTKPAVWSELGIDAAGFADLPHATTKAVMLRVERRGKSAFKDTDIPNYHFRYFELTKENAISVLKGDHVFLDLRSRADALKAVLPGAIPFEYGAATGADKQFRFDWAAKVSQIAGIELNVAAISELARDPLRGKSKIIVVGNGPGDGRVYWILRQLSIAGVSSAYWYNGNVAELTPFLKK